MNTASDPGIVVIVKPDNTRIVMEDQFADDMKGTPLRLPPLKPLTFDSLTLPAPLSCLV